MHQIYSPFAKNVRCSPVAVRHKRLWILIAKESRNVDEIDPGRVITSNEQTAKFMYGTNCEVYLWGTKKYVGKFFSAILRQGPRLKKRGSKKLISLVIHKI